MGRMTVRFWGTRGSIPTPGRKTEKYGGNTTCIEIGYEDTTLVLDAGSGIRELSRVWERELSDRARVAHLLLTHLHWDHIQGFPFFSPAYKEGNSFVIWGQDRQGGGVRDLLGGQMAGAYFPVPFDAMKADLQFQNTSPEFEIGPVKIKTELLPHPGGSLGYRIEAGGSIFVFATDCELDQAARNRDEVAEDNQRTRQYEDELLQFFVGANLLVIDCQYTDAEHRSRVGWGHNAIATVVDLCAQVQPDMISLFHHDPSHTDHTISWMVDDVTRRLNSLNVSEMLVFAAREGLMLRVEKPKRPPRLLRQ